MAEAENDMRTQGRGFRGFLRKLWRGGSFKEVHVQRERLRARDEILESGELYIHRTDGAPSQDEIDRSVIEKLTHQNIDQLLSEESGETHRRIDDETDPEAQEVRGAVNDLISRYARGELDDENFEEEKNRVLHVLAQNNPELLGEGRMFADNLLLVAQNVKSMVRHDRGVDEIMANAIIDLGQIRTDARTEARYSSADKVIERIQSTRLGKWLNETTIVTAASIATSVARLTVQSGVAKAAAVTGVLGVGGAVIAGARQSKVVKDERRRHSREMASGERFEPGAKRRERLEGSRYETISAVDATRALQQLFEEPEDGTNLRNLHELTKEGFIEASMLVAQLRTRDAMSDEEQIDLFHYSSAEGISDERLQLQLTAIYAQDALDRYLEAHGGVEWLREVGIVDGIDNFQQLLSVGSQAYESIIREDMSDKDAVFKRIHRSEVLKAAMIGGTIGVVVGLSVQEAMAHLPGIGDRVYGIGEGKAMPGGRNTLLGGVFNSDKPGFSGNLTEVGGSGRFADVEGFRPHKNSSGNWIIERTLDGKKIELAYDDKGLLTPGSKRGLSSMGFDVHSKVEGVHLSGQTQDVVIGNNKIVIPSEFKLQQSPTGQWELLNPDGTKSQDIGLNFDGSLTDASIAHMQSQGVGVTATPNLVTETIKVDGRGPIDIIQNHLGDTTRIHRGLWYGNNTPSPNFDLNELRPHAGGVNGSWFDDHDNVVIDISKMKPNWSFQNGHSVNPFQATSEGRMSLAVSLSKDTQGTVFDFKFSTLPDGRTIATIPPSNPAHQLFQMEGGKRVFKGGFFEVAEHTGQQSPNGAQGVNILATYPGQNNPGALTDTITTTKTVYDTLITPKPPTENIEVITYNGSTPVEAAPVIPFYARRGLERTVPRNSEDRYNYYMYGLPSNEELRELMRDTIPVLLDDPRSMVDTGEAVRWYEGVLRRRHGDAYIDELNSTIDTTPELHSLDSDTRAIIAIPVGGFEGENIYDTLSLYGQQPESETAHTPIVLHVNWRQSDVRTVEGQNKLKDTLDAIERARTKYPDLNIAVIQSAWTDEQVEHGIIGLATRKLYDTIIMATNRAVEEDRVGSDQEIVLIRNDADTKGMSSGYIGKMVESVTSDSVDASVGRLKWGIEQTQDLPGFSVVMQFLEGMRGSARRAREQGIDVNVQTAGANTSVRLSTLASVGSIGFSDYTDAGSDDIEVGRRISLVRRTNSPLHTGSSYSRRTKRFLRRAFSDDSFRESDREYIEGDDTDSTIVIASGATIDTNSARLEGQYINGDSIGRAWAGFKGTSRDAKVPTTRSGEDLETDFDSVVKNIETQLASVVVDWAFDRRIVEMELRRSFPPERGSTESMYEATFEPDGTMKFNFTESGKKLLKRRLTRNNSGQFDPIGSRRLRVNYGRSTGRRRFPEGRTPRLVGT